MGFHKMFIINLILICFRRSPYGAEANELLYDIIVNKFKLQSRYYVNFRTNTVGKKYEISYNSDPTMEEKVPLQSFHKDCFGIK